MKYYRKSVFSFATLILVVALSIPVMAQDNKQEVNTIFGGNNGQLSNGGWGGLTFGYTKINGQDTYLMGARGGWLVNHRLTIGLAGNGFISDKQYDIIYYDNNGNLEEGALNLTGGYGGLFLEATILPFSPVHITIPLIIGAGGVAYTRSWWENDYDNNYYDNYTLDSDAFFVFEPGLEIEFNLIKFMRLGVGGSYRYTSRISLVESSSAMLRGFNGHFSLKFGKF